MSQKLFNMEPINYNNHLFYPFFYKNEVLCLPYDYKAYAKELIDDFPKWKRITRSTAMHDYALRLFKTQDSSEVDFQQIYANAIESALPDFVSEKEVEDYIIKTAKKSEFPIYHLSELLQLNNQQEFILQTDEMEMQV